MRKGFTRIISMIIVTAMLLSLFSMISVTALDYNEHWAKESIETLIKGGYIEADANGNVFPDKEMTRGAFVRVVNKVCVFTEKADTNFPDVLQYHKYYDDFLIAKKAGYITGDENGNANPDGVIKRCEIAAILARVLGLDVTGNDISMFDEADVPVWAMQHVAALNKAGIMQGYGDGTFGGNRLITNAEGYTMAARILETLPGACIPQVTPNPDLPKTTPAPAYKVTNAHKPVTVTSLKEGKSINVKYNGQTVAFSSARPKLIDSQIWVNAENLGNAMNMMVYPLLDNSGLVLENDEVSMTVKYGDTKAYLSNGETIATKPAFFENNRTFMLLDTIMTAFNMTYTWDPEICFALVEGPTYDFGTYRKATKDLEYKSHGGSRDVGYTIFSTDKDAKVTVWKKESKRWTLTSRPTYSAEDGGFVGSTTHVGEGGTATLKVKMEYSNGSEDTFTISQSTKTIKDKVPHDEMTPPAPEVLLRATFNNISVYYDAAEKAASNTVEYRKKGDSSWKYGFRLQYDDDDKQYRGSIVGLSDNTEYEVRVTLKDINGNVMSQSESSIKTQLDNVPIAKTINLKDIYVPGEPLSLHGIKGTADGYIRILGDDETVVEVTDRYREACEIGDCEYMILENVKFKGGAKHGIVVTSSNQYVRITNCDISFWGRRGTFVPEDGLYYDYNNSAINNDAAIYLSDAKHIVVEKNYVHDPKGRSNAWSGPEWKNIHPQGPNAIYMRGNEGIVIRYNDFVGSDEHRWNDSIESYHNFGITGGIGWDADVYGNYLVFGQDDSTEMDGTQMNVRFYGNKIEGFLCGISTAGNTVGPSYVYRNLVYNLGDDVGKVGSGTKNGNADEKVSIGYTFFFHNTIIMNTGGSGFNQTGLYYRSYGRNNIIETRSDDGTAAINTSPAEDVSEEYDLYRGKITTPYGQTMFGVPGRADFVNRDFADFRLNANSPGIDIGQILPNFNDGYKGNGPDAGAFEEGEDGIFPTRPIALRADKYQVNLRGVERHQVTVQVGNVPEGTTYKILKNEVFDWFDVKNSAGTDNGTLTPNSSITFYINGDFAEVGTDYQGNQFARGNGAFIIKLSDGSSLPITVYLNKIA